MVELVEFLSDGRYVTLPSKRSPRVILAVDSHQLASNAFKLFNPFSTKGKCFSFILKFLACYFNPLFRAIMADEVKEASLFIKYLEAKLGRQLISSVYLATVADKVVLQLQSLDAEIIGYLKIPLNDLGIEHLVNEKNAIEVLSAKGIVSSYLLHDVFDERPFLLLSPVAGESCLVERESIDKLLGEFERGESFSLSEHPRIELLRAQLKTNDLVEYLIIVEDICQVSVMDYGLVYEHGDFTPWNILREGDKYVPFDFEHFVENGLQYFDLVKYYYQIGKLLEGRRGHELVEHIQTQLHISENLLLLQLYLIKEIVRFHEEGQPYDSEVDLLKLVREI
ncbi:MAG: hypothetical protein HRU20_03130 [Pseudomonadales bacterium]|nr:hypothetical protein [Pseudomonadales bacterium]